MASVNKVILIGNLGRDPEVRYTPSGTAVVSWSIATTRSWKDKSTGEKVEETEWHRLVSYDHQAEIVGEYLKKGSAVYIEGRLKTRKWQDKDGTDKYTTEIVVEQLQMLGGRERAEGEQQRQAAPAARPARAAAPAPARSSTGTGFDDLDDDIPFISCCESFDMQPAGARKMRRYRY